MSAADEASKFGPAQERLALEKDRRELQMGKIHFADLEPCQILGVGSFAHVRLVVHKPTNTPYALKCVYKGTMVALNQTPHLLSEVQILRKIAHPFIPRLAATYKDHDMLYLLMDYVPGGELATVLRRQRRFPEPVAAFYAAIVVSVFEFLHDRQIVYRDLRPENLLFDANGYLKLIDFGFAKEVQTKTWTLCGTPEYLAPEIILNKGHDVGCDWWALGIFVYEMLVGAPPFSDDFDPMVIYAQALKGVVSEPTGTRPLAKDARNLVDRLLVREPTQRLGCMKLGTDEVKRHAFFSNLKWHRLEKKLIQPPYVPELSDPTDTSCFECDGLVTPRNEHKAHAHAGTAHMFDQFSEPS